MSVYRKIYDLIEKAIFINQAKNVDEVLGYIRANSNLRSLDRREIDRLIHVVATQYKSEQNSA